MQDVVCFLNAMKNNAFFDLVCFILLFLQSILLCKFIKSVMVSIITVNYNGCEDTCELIDSLARNETYPYEVIVVDNASAGNDVLILKSRYPGLCIVESNRNLGFAGGNNLGYAHAKGEFILFLNNDVIIAEPILENLVKRLEDPLCGLVSPLIMYYEPSDRIQFAGFTPLSPITLRNQIIGTGEINRGQYDQPHETPYVHGACMIGRKETIEKVGLMTDIYFLFYEELDWCEQFRKKGYQLWYDPSSVIYHKESMTARKGSPLRLYYMTRARLIFARRNLKGMNKYLSCLYLISIVLIKESLKYLCHGDWKMLRATCKGTWSGINV